MLLILVLFFIQIIGSSSYYIDNINENTLSQNINKRSRPSFNRQTILFSLYEENMVENYVEEDWGFFYPENEYHIDEPIRIPCPNLKREDLFNGVKDKSKCTQCGSFETVCFLDLSFLTNQSNQWDEKLFGLLIDNKDVLNEKCSVYKDNFYGITSSSDTKKSNNCKNYIKSLMRTIESESSPKCLYDNIFKSQNYATCV